MSELAYVAPDFDPDTLCGFAWGCLWALMPLRGHLVTGEHVIFSLSRN